MWIPHAKEGWICGEITSIDAGKNQLVVTPEDGGEVKHIVISPVNHQLKVLLTGNQSC